MGLKGREKEAIQIFKAQIESAVGQLFLGKFNKWDDFFDVITIDFLSLPRKNLKSGSRDVKSRLSKETKKFFQKNFHNSSFEKIRSLCHEIAKNQGFEIPLNQFEDKYFSMRAEVLKGTPRHATLVISLWGLKFQFPEDEFVKDITQCLDLLRTVSIELDNFKNAGFEDIRNKQNQVSDLSRTKNFCTRSCILSCFNLVEAYLNGIAWEYVENNPSLEGLSKTKERLIRDTSQASLREKIIKYPNIISGRPIWKENHHLVRKFLETNKPFRDSLVHPSPFSVPEKFGGYDKLKILYRLDLKEAKETVETTFSIISNIHKHLYPDSDIPQWLIPLKVAIAN